MKTKTNIFGYSLLIVISALAVFPILYTIANSFMSAAEIRMYYGSLGAEGAETSPFHLIPNRITLSGYYNMLLERPHYLIKFWQSLGVCAAIVAGQVVISSLGGYAFSKHRFPGRNVIFFFLIALMMMPNQVMLVPSYITLDAMGLIGSYYALVLPLIFSAFGVFLMSQIMAVVPDSILESAKIDGAGHFRVLTRIMLPNCKAGLASLVILGFIDCWNMVEQPLVFLKESYKHPFSLFLLQINAAEPALGFACGILAMIPVLLLFKFFEEELISGIGYSVLK
ncbi:MAG: carbohydrate ABC transporter permease [Oscillospiraceae bacterium]|nr:carbohydrate ABC transporter permease [Oscillospiraceae bacterium]